MNTSRSLENPLPTCSFSRYFVFSHYFFIQTLLKHFCLWEFRSTTAQRCIATCRSFNSLLSNDAAPRSETSKFLFSRMKRRASKMQAAKWKIHTHGIRTASRRRDGLRHVGERSGACWKAPSGSRERESSGRLRPMYRHVSAPLFLTLSQEIHTAHRRSGKPKFLSRSAKVPVRREDSL